MESREKHLTCGWAALSVAVSLVAALFSLVQLMSDDVSLERVLYKPWQSAHPQFEPRGRNIRSQSKTTVYCSNGALTSQNYDSTIYTGNIASDGQAEATPCLLIAEGKVSQIGTSDDVQAAKCLEERQTTRCSFIELQKGQSIIPGLHDAHGHLLDLGWARTAVDLVGATSVQDAVKRIEEYIVSRPELFANKSQWIEGLGWDQTKWHPSVFPTAADLEKSSILANRRIILRRIDVHALWVSKAALEELLQNELIPPVDREIEGGLIIRDGSGNPNGCFIDRAMDIVYKIVPVYSDEDRKVFLRSAGMELLSNGITSIGDASVDLKTLEFYARQDKSSAGLPLRIYAMLSCSPDIPHCADLAHDKGFPQVAAPFTRSRLTVRTRKLFADGALGSWGSAMWEPYADRTHDSWKGLMLIPEDEIEAIITYWHREGWNIATHCIGDRAQSLVLDAYESILASIGPSADPRFRIEHAQLVRPRDISRFGSLGIIASVQPTHCTSDMTYAGTRLGPQRAKLSAYPWQSFLASNVSLALGSDFPVEPPNAIHGIYSAVTRLDASGDSPHGPSGWYPEQRLTRAQALHGFTAVPAYAQFEEQSGGTLTPGKRADLVVLQGDIIREDVEKLREVHPIITILDGEVAWRRV